MRNKNLWIILAAVVLIAVVAVLGLVIKPAPAELNGGAIVTPVPETTQSPEEQPSSYLLVTVGDITYEPLPLYGEGEFSITQEEGMVNVVHVTGESVNMASSTCDNQDCVEQGTVSLATMNERVLGNMIICLPHQLTLQLYTVDEMNALIASLAGEVAP